MRFRGILFALNFAAVLGEEHKRRKHHKKKPCPKKQKPCPTAPDYYGKPPDPYYGDEPCYSYYQPVPQPPQVQIIQVPCPQTIPCPQVAPPCVPQQQPCATPPPTLPPSEPGIVREGPTTPAPPTPATTPAPPTPATTPAPPTPGSDETMVPTKSPLSWDETAVPTESGFTVIVTEIPTSQDETFTPTNQPTLSPQSTPTESTTVNPTTKPVSQVPTHPDGTFIPTNPPTESPTRTTTTPSITPTETVNLVAPTDQPSESVTLSPTQLGTPRSGPSTSPPPTPNTTPPPYVEECKNEAAANTFVYQCGSYGEPHVDSFTGKHKDDYKNVGDRVLFSYGDIIVITTQAIGALDCFPDKASNIAAKIKKGGNVWKMAPHENKFEGPEGAVQVAGDPSEISFPDRPCFKLTWTSGDPMCKGDIYNFKVEFQGNIAETGGECGDKGGIPRWRRYLDGAYIYEEPEVGLVQFLSI